MSTGIKARIIGRGLRLLMGGALVAEAARHLVGGSTTMNFRVVAVVVGLFLFYTVVHVLVARFTRSVNRWVGAFVAVAPLILVFVAGGSPGQLGTLLFIGVSLLVTALLGDGGCEVMTLPALVVGRRTHLVCIVFSPIDWLEQKLSAGRNRRQVQPE